MCVCYVTGRCVEGLPLAFYRCCFLTTLCLFVFGVFPARTLDDVFKGRFFWDVG